jgi:two-component system, LytTR family, response regulator LytT
MIRAVIIEDEKYASQYLQDLLKIVAPDIEVIGVLESISAGLKFLPFWNADLVFADIQLEDGVSFKIFEQLEWKKPVIFITAYDSFAIRAFKVNGIDYLLKPVNEEELKKAVDKFRIFSVTAKPFDFNVIKNLISERDKKFYKERFVVTLGSRILSIPVNDIAYFFFTNKTTCLVNWEGQKYPYSESLDNLSDLLDPLEFFRVNRNFIIRHKAIDRIEHHAGRNILISLNPLPSDGSIRVSKDRISEFKCWLDK